MYLGALRETPTQGPCWFTRKASLGLPGYGVYMDFGLCKVRGFGVPSRAPPKECVLVLSACLLPTRG